MWFSASLFLEGLDFGVKWDDFVGFHSVAVPTGGNEVFVLVGASFCSRNDVIDLKISDGKLLVAVMAPVLVPLADLKPFCDTLTIKDSARC